ncbi:MAG: hypothetical protein HQ579_09375 [Candidatus Omnitrophica bacterium]|nr:hypothetical protein [Candidatus Omnitrophota bacterium]
MIFNRKIFTTAILAVAFILAVSCISYRVYLSGLPVRVQLVLSRRAMLVGDMAKCELYISAKKDIEIEPLEVEKNLSDFIIKENGRSEKTFRGKKNIRLWFLITAYEIGFYRIAPVEVRYRLKGEQRWRFIESAGKSLTVKSLLGAKAYKDADISVSGELSTEKGLFVSGSRQSGRQIGGDAPFIYDIKDKVSPKEIRTPGDIIVKTILFAAGFAALLLGAAIIAKILFSKQPKIIPPDKEALDRIRRLKSKIPDKRDGLREFYSDLALILKEYIRKRFKTNPAELTTEEFISEIYSIKELNAGQKDSFKDFFRTCDTVKYSPHNADRGKALFDLEFTEKLINKTRHEENTRQKL